MSIKPNFCISPLLPSLPYKIEKREIIYTRIYMCRPRIGKIANNMLTISTL